MESVSPSGGTDFMYFLYLLSPFLYLFLFIFKKMDLYIHFVSSARMGQNVYIIPILLGVSGSLETLRANSSPRVSSSVLAGRARRSLGPAALRLRPVAGRPSTAGWTPAARLSQISDVNGGVATIKCTTPAGLREGKGR